MKANDENKSAYDHEDDLSDGGDEDAGIRCFLIVLIVREIQMDAEPNCPAHHEVLDQLAHDQSQQ